MRSIAVRRSLLLLLFAAVRVTFVAADGSSPLILHGVHDPAQLLRVGDALRLYASAVEWWAYDITGRDWHFLGDALYDDDNPDWDLGDGAYWAPSIVPLDNGQYRLYHSAVHDEEHHGSRIGFASGTLVDGEIEWEPVDDYVIESDGYEQPFAIDPALFHDDDGRHWLVYGSHAAGIWIVEIDPRTGLLAERPWDKRWAPEDNRFTHLANYGGHRYDENNIEAAYVYNHPESEFYYLFVNWDRCCSGIHSTYNIRVGRSESPTGPFFDREGLPLHDGGGTLFLDESGEFLGDDRFVGPGHSGIYRHDDGRYYFSHHFYDAYYAGTPSLAVWRMTWVDRWPQIQPGLRVSFD